MRLCEACSTVSVPNLTSELQDAPDWWAEGYSQSQPRGMVHLKDACQLKQSAATCPLCALIRDAILQYNANETLPRSGLGSQQKQEQWNVVDFEHHLTNEPIYLRPKRDFLRRAFPEKNVENAWHLRGMTAFVPVQGDILTGQIRLVAPLDSNAAISCEIIGRPALSSSDCPEAYQLIRRWMKTCVQHHKTCRETLSGTIVDESSPPILPSRIIDVGTPGTTVDPCLIETRHGATGYYAALSHCWGPRHKRPLMTTRLNLQDRLKRIPWKDIPKVYQNVITAIRQIDLRYIWIDSLCIIQDDHEDWFAESKLMGRVYENARLTVAASHAANADEGCFFDRPEPKSSVELPHVTTAGERNGSIFATSMPENYNDISPEAGVLATRAWATQEWLLSRRVLFYTRGCLVWSCKTITQRETGGSFHSTARNSRWKFIMEKYSARLLTHATDRLIALEGLRQEMQKKTRDTYCFGLWKNNLPGQLLWFCMEPAERAVNPLDLPTWTWASTMHGIRFLSLDKARNVCERIKFDEDRKTLTIRSRLKRAPKLTMALGLERGSFVDPKDRLITAKFSTFKEEVRNSRLDAVCAIHTDQEDILGWAVLDEGRLPPSSIIFCLALMGRKRRIYESETLDDGDKIQLQEDWVLLLRKSITDENIYVRVGAGKIFWKSWFAEEPLQNVCIR